MLLQASTATSDPYFSHFDPRTEHQSYKDAQQRLEETHREKVIIKNLVTSHFMLPIFEDNNTVIILSKITKVMKEWSELEDRYQQMMNTDPAAAQTFRQRMTAKFQANIQVGCSYSKAYKFYGFIFMVIFCYYPLTMVRLNLSQNIK